MDAYEFINRSTNIGIDTSEIREKLSHRFDLINTRLVCAHCNADPFYMADYLLSNQEMSGPFVEFGCYQAGMSCKLSLVAELLNKKYIIFDSFRGLPSTARYDTYDKNWWFLGDFREGDFSCHLEKVRRNIEKYGSINSCEFVPGLIEYTLPFYDLRPITFFIDVDILPTAKFIIKQLWNSVEGDRIFTHESCIKEYMEGLLDRSWWESEMGESIPEVGRHPETKLPNLPRSMCLTYLKK